MFYSVYMLFIYFILDVTTHLLANQHKGHSINSTSNIESRVLSRNPVNSSEMITI